LDHLYTFKGFPILMDCVEHVPEKDLKVDMSWWVSRSTGSIQVNPLIPLEILYNTSHGSGSVGTLWMTHHQQLAAFIAQRDCRSVLEIGGGHGILAQCYQTLCPDASWTIVEPNPTVVPTANLRVVRRVFDRSFEITDKYDAVVHSHLFEHMYDPSDFLWQLRGPIKDGGYLVFSVPNLEAQFRNNVTYCLGFEHTVFLTEDWIEFLLAKNGYSVHEKKSFSGDHSIFYSATKREVESPSLIELPKQYDRHKREFANYIQFHITMVERMNQSAGETAFPVFLFGGHVSSQYLLAYGLDPKAISCILDNDKKKHGKRLYGSSLIIKSPRILRGLGPVKVILRQGVFNEEIKKEILENINPQVEFWE
jgi:2-polyprenyl-3-methyl-5-hydroxy-6-metoxy-1,4-benzoquinol methylase